MYVSKGSSQQLADEAVAILESISDGFFSVNADWEFVYLNQRAEGLLGASREQLIGKTIWEAYPGLAGTEFETVYRTAMREHAAAEVTSWYPEHERWYEVRIAPVAGGLSFYFHDVSAQVATEQALRESERNFRQLAESIPQIVWIVTAAGEGVYFSRQWEDYTGVAIDSTTPADVANQFVHDDDQAATMAAWTEAYQHRRAFQVEHRIRSKAGEYRWFLVRAEPYLNAAGEIERWFGTSTDIHEAKTARIALRESEERYRSLFESMDDGFAIVEVLFGDDGKAADLRFRQSNSVFAQLAGVASVAGKTVRVLAPGDDQHWIELCARVALTGKSIRQTNEYRLFGGWFDLHAYRVDDPAEHRVAVIFKDIGERRQAREALALKMRDLRAERDQSRQIFDSMNEGFSLLDSDWTILQINEIGARLSRKPRAALLERNLWSAMPRLAGGPVEALYRRVQAHARAETLEHSHPRSDGSVVWFESRAYPLPEGRLAVFFRDITERKAVEDRLRDADRRKDEFLAMLAHELRNPLAPIGAAAHLLRLGRLDEARIRHTSQIIGRQVDHMIHLIDDLLDVSRVTRGLVELETAPLDIREVLGDAIEQVAPLIQAKRHRLQVHMAPEPALVMGDKKRLVQVVTNILNNAAKYTPEGGAIRLRSEALGGHVSIEIADDGIGMTPDLAARVFDLFAQAERSSDRSAGGLGLGLALVKNMVELHGGSVACHSAGPGLGSRFRVCLPRLSGGAGPDPAGAETQAGAPAGTALRVLVVDDNADAAAMLGMVLESFGHQVAIEHGSRAALARARSERPQVCILDIGLPEIDGNELARRLHAQPETADAVLIAVTGYGHDSDRRQSLAAGFAHHLVKPADTGQLAQILAEIAGGRGAAT